MSKINPLSSSFNNCHPAYTERHSQFKILPIHGCFRKEYSTRMFVKVGPNLAKEVIKDKSGNLSFFKEDGEAEFLDHFMTWHIMPNPIKLFKDVDLLTAFVDLSTGLIMVKQSETTATDSFGNSLSYPPDFITSRTQLVVEETEFDEDDLEDSEECKKSKTTNTVKWVKTEVALEAS